MAPTIDYAEGFETRADTTQVASGVATQAVFSFINNGAAITYTTGRVAGVCIDIDDTNIATATNARATIADTQQSIWGVWFRLPDGPAADTDSRLFSITDSSNNLMMYFSSITAGNIRCRVGGGSGTVQNSAATTYGDAAWHLLEFEFLSNGTTWTVNWQIDGVTQTSVSEGSHVATNQSILFLGSGAATNNAHVQFDDIIRSTTNGEYPLSQYLDASQWVIRLKGPSGDGTHSTGTNSVIGDGGETTNLYQKVDDWLTGATAANDYLTYTSTSTGDAASRYAEIALQNLTGDETAIWLVVGNAGATAAGTGANSMRVQVLDSSNNGLGYITDDVSEITVRYHRLNLTVPSGGWLTDFNGAKMRIGLCNLDTNPLPRISAVGLQVLAIIPVTPPSNTVTATIYKRVAGTDTSLQSETISAPGTNAVIRFELSGTTLTGKIDGSTVVTTTDSSITTGVKAGLGMTVTQGIGTSTHDVSLDSFEAGVNVIDGVVLSRTRSQPAGLLKSMMPAVALARTRSQPAGSIAVSALPVSGVALTRDRFLNPGTIVASFTALVISRSRSLPAGMVKGGVTGIVLTRTRELPTGLIGDASVQVVGMPIGF